MEKRKWFLAFFALLTIRYILFIPPVRAVCPVCTIAVGAGLGISRALGIDDAVTSIWIGGLILSMGFWTIDWLEKKKFKRIEALKKRVSKRYFDLGLLLLFYLFTLLPLYLEKYIGRPYNTLLGADKILFGTLLGSLAFLAGKTADEKIRKIKGKQLFIYEKVIFPVSLLIIISIILDTLVIKLPL